MSIIGLAAYTYTVDTPADRQRRLKTSSVERIHEAAAMIVARGSDRCMNPQCRDPAGSGFYCPGCEEDPRVQHLHNRRLKAIGALWDSAGPYLLRRTFHEATPAPSKVQPAWPLEKREAWLAERRAEAG